MSDPFGIKSSKRAAKFQEEANDLTRRQQNLQSAMRRRQYVREARIARANAQQSAASQGVVNSSAAQGGQGSLQSQFTSNLSFLDNQNLFQDQISQAIGSQRKYEAKAQRSQLIWNTALKGIELGSKFI